MGGDLCRAREGGQLEGEGQNIFAKNIFTKNIFIKNTFTKNVFFKNISEKIYKLFLNVLSKIFPKKGGGEAPLLPAGPRLILSDSEISA